MDELLALRRVLCLLLILVSPALMAQSDSGYYTIEKKKKEIQELDRQIEAERQAVEPQVQANGERVDGYNANLEALRARIAANNAAFNNWNASCLGRPARQGDSCYRWQAEIIAESNAIQAERARLRGQKRGIDDANADIVAFNARLRELYERRQALIDEVSRLEDASYERSSACLGLSEASPETLKHKCGNVGFDGAASGLGPCTTERCRRYEALRNGGQ